MDGRELGRCIEPWLASIRSKPNHPSVIYRNYKAQEGPRRPVFRLTELERQRSKIAGLEKELRELKQQTGWVRGEAKKWNWTGDPAETARIWLRLLTSHRSSRRGRSDGAVHRNRQRRGG